MSVRLCQHDNPKVHAIYYCMYSDFVACMRIIICNENKQVYSLTVTIYNGDCGITEEEQWISIATSHSWL